MKWNILINHTKIDKIEFWQWQMPENIVSRKGSNKKKSFFVSQKCYWHNQWIIQLGTKWIGYTMTPYAQKSVIYHLFWLNFYRSEVESAVTAYVQSHYPYGVSTVYSSVADGNITLIACIESHQFQPRNFWNGRWRSQWSVTFSESGGSFEVTGILRVQVNSRHLFPILMSFW